MNIKVDENETIDSLIQKYVDLIAAQKYSDTKFIVSLGGKYSEYIYLTIYDKPSFTEKLLSPKQDNGFYGLEFISKVMESLYNRTM